MAALFILLPLFLVMLLNLPLKKFMRPIVFWAILAVSCMQLIAVIFYFQEVSQQTLPILASVFNFPLAMDSLTRVMLVGIAMVTISSAMIANSLAGNVERRFNYLNILLIILGGMNGVVLVKDIFSLYVFLEITALSAFILIAFRRDRHSLEGAYKYIVFSSIATVLLLASIALLILFTGDTSFAALSTAIKGQGNQLVVFSIAIFIVGLMIKSGLMPFHGWLPDAYSTAPDSASLLLAGIVTKTVGVYPLIRIVYSVFGFSVPVNNILMFFGAASIVFGAFAALTQADLKRMLAYSSISQVGYIILSLGCGSLLGMAGAVFHIFNHAVFKSTLFANAAAIDSKVSSYDLENLGGLAQKMPVTGTVSALACLSVAGIPPLAGFWSKLIIILALWASNNYFYAVIAVLSSIVTLAYMLTLQRKVFFGKPDAKMQNVTEAKFSVLLPGIILACVMIAVSISFPFLLGTFIIPLKGI